MPHRGMKPRGWMLRSAETWVSVVLMTTNPTESQGPALQVIEGGEQMERESAEALLAFLKDPFSVEAEAALRALEARRAPRGSLRSV